MQFNVKDKGLPFQYITCLYFTIQTMVTVGYGDYPPKTRHEKIYGILSMMISTFLYTYTLNSIGSIVKHHNTMAAKFREEMLYVNKFLIN